MDYLDDHVLFMILSSLSYRDINNLKLINKKMSERILRSVNLRVLMYRDLSHCLFHNDLDAAMHLMMTHKCKTDSMCNYAIDRRDFELFKLACKCGCVPSVATAEMAIDNEMHDAFTLILDVNMFALFEYHTLIFYAIKRDNLKIIQFFDNAGILRDIKNFGGELQRCAAKWNSLECLKFLHSMGYAMTESALRTSIFNRNYDCLTYICDNCELNLPEIFIQTKCEYGMRYLISRGIPLHKGIINSFPLHFSLELLVCAHSSGYNWDNSQMMRNALLSNRKDITDYIMKIGEYPPSHALRDVFDVCIEISGCAIA